MANSYDSLYNNSVSFDPPPPLQLITWVVPTGVKSIAFELWGGGGGGGNLGGGQGGGYVKGAIPVVANNQVILTVGAGGYGGLGASAPGKGGDTSLSYGGNTFKALGGAANGTYNYLGYSIPGNIGWGLTGQYGCLFEDISYTETPALGAGTTSYFNTIYKFGNGGNGAGSINTLGRGAIFIVQQSLTSPYPTKLITLAAAIDGSGPGGGGGAIGCAGINLATLIQTSKGGNGGIGKAIIYYNL